MFSGIATLGYLVGMLIWLLVAAAVLFVLYFVIRAAVLSALRKHRAELALESEPQSFVPR